MALFQKSVLNQYLKDLDKTKAANAYTLFKAHFHNATIQQQIRDSKEEQYQEGFCRDLFVNALGYTLNPQPSFNLTTEQKNETDNKKADGAILKDGNVIAVIELKGTNTTDLNTVTPQAFGYKNNQKNCKYVLISNFEKLRFYIDNAIDFEEFNLFTLTENEFALLYLCLQCDNLLSDLPNKIKQASTVKEENITKQLYKDYSDLKRKLFADIVHLNPQYDKLILFKKSQKLLDRILFILFAEDRSLIPVNTIHTILTEWQQLQKLNVNMPLYDRFKNHFNYLNVGFKNDAYEVYGYNGGLFAEDEILDNIKISDNLLQNYVPVLSKYDYETDVDVNILGHIFEHSLNDIEEIQAELEGKEIDKAKTKRKRDGVFYTPKYITKYIVENTVGALCTEKRNEYGIIADNYTPDKRKARKKELLEKLDTYQSWLLQITIADPACGSGAFLNQALDFLIQEHKSIDELRAQLLGHSFVLPDHEIEILENNIFGVDLNEESVEIARLSLWLRTARKGRKLNSLNNNIKCGNSLIDDVSIAGEKAFNWQNEFPQIFEKKDKQAFHIVLTTHNSRTSQRMIEKGVIKGEPLELNTKQEILLTEIIKNIIVEKYYNCLAYNICKDHVHIILVCERDELNDTVKTIKGKSAYLFNKVNGLKPIGESIEKHELEPNGFQPVRESNKSVKESIEKYISLPNRFQPVEESIEKHTSEPNGFQPVEKSNKPIGESIEKHEHESYGFQPIANKEIHNGHLWSQKFFRANLDVWELNTVTNKPGYIYKDTYLQNAIEYVRNNRKKHELPQSDKLESIIESFCTDEETAFKQEHKGGFDVVIGNPPYVSHDRILGKDYLKTNYKCFSAFTDLYSFFYEKGILILKPKGFLYFITSNSFLKAEYGRPLRELIIKNTTIKEVINIEETQLFGGAIVNTVLLSIQKDKNSNIECNVLNKVFNQNESFYDFIENNFFTTNQSYFTSDSWNLSTNENESLKQKIKSKFKTLEELNTQIRLGIATGDNNAFIIDEEKKKDLIFKDSKSIDLIKPILRGRDINRYRYTFDNKYIILTRNEIDVVNQYKGIFDYLNTFDDKFKNRGAKGKHWTNLRACSFFDDFKLEKIVWIELTDKPKFTLITDEIYLLNTAYFILPPKGFSSKYLLSLLNSKVITFYLKMIANTSGVGTTRWINIYVKEFPIPQIEITDQQPFIEKAETMLQKNKELQTIKSNVVKLLQSQYSGININTKLSNWNELTFKDFIKELEKQKIKISISEKAELMQYFEAEQIKANSIQQTITQTDKEIDQMVYKLYELSDEEIAIVEQEN